jgi:NAD+ kinase
MIGVVGDATDTVTTALETAGKTVRSGTAGRVADGDLDAIVAVGGPALTALVGDGRVPEIPVLAVGAGPGFLDTGDVADAAGALGRGDYVTVDHPVFGVAVGDEHAGNAVADVMVVTSDPGSISEFRIGSGTEIDRVRADGVVVATPAGSHGYARSAGGPRLHPGVDAAAVVPVAAFTMSPDQWVVGLDAPVEITSERDVPVSLLLDHERRRLRPGRTVTVTAVDAIDLVVPGGVE